MIAMILAAGRGERLRPLTNHTPKPLIKVRGQPVIAYTLTRLAELGIKKVVINACYLAEKLTHYVGDGSNWGVKIHWSHEQQCLDTGGGVVQALPHVGPEPFLVVNGDILWNMDLTPLLAAFDPQTMDGLLAVVKRPDQHQGDFYYHELPIGNGTTGQLQRIKDNPDRINQTIVTYSGIQVLRPQAFVGYHDSPFSLNRFYDASLQMDRLRGILLDGKWADMGTPERLEKAEKIGWT